MHREVFIQMIHERHTGRYIHAGDLFIRDPFQVLSERADGIPMGCDQDLLSLSDFRTDHAFEVRSHTCDRILQAFRQRELYFILEFLIRSLVFRASWIICRKSRRTDVIGTTPQMDLLAAVLIRSLCLVESLQRPVVTLIQVIILLDGDPGEIHLIEHRVCRMNGTLQYRCIAFVEGKSLFSEQAACLTRFAVAFLRQLDIRPAAE